MDFYQVYQILKPLSKKLSSFYSREVTPKLQIFHKIRTIAYLTNYMFTGSFDKETASHILKNNKAINLISKVFSNNVSTGRTITPVERIQLGICKTPNLLCPGYDDDGRTSEGGLGINISPLALKEFDQTNSLRLGEEKPILTSN